MRYGKEKVLTLQNGNDLPTILTSLRTYQNMVSVSGY